MVGVGELVEGRRLCDPVRGRQRRDVVAQGLRVAGNIEDVVKAARQFQRESLTETVKQALQDSGLPPELLELEITESVAVLPSQLLETTLADFRAQGISVAIDDFGTGYSSLSYLSRFPINFLKIDRSFIQDIDISSERLEIIRAIVSLADSLKIDVVAEGVETASQLAQLCSLQPTSGQEHFAQGYLFSKPLNRDAAKNLIASGRDCYVPSIS